MDKEGCRWGPLTLTLPASPASCHPHEWAWDMDLAGPLPNTRPREKMAPKDGEQQACRLRARRGS